MGTSGQTHISMPIILDLVRFVFPILVLEVCRGLAARALRGSPHVPRALLAFHGSSTLAVLTSCF